MDLDLVSSTDSSGRSVLTMVGALDLESRTRLAEAAETQLAAGPTGLVLDMAGVDFVDSTGIGAVIEIGRRADDGGATFAIRNPSKRVIRILEVTGLMGEWNIESDTPAS